MMNKDRLAVLIGKNGSIKRTIEKLTNTNIVIDSATGEYVITPVEISTETKNKDESSDPEYVEVLSDEDFEEILNENIDIAPSFSVWLAENIIQAINIGFKPKKAFKLLLQDYSIEKFYLEKIVGNSEKKNKRLMGRLIGEKGRMRNAIEQYSNVFVSIYPENKTIGLIGDFESLKIARKAVNMLLDGLPHHVVLNFLLKKSRERKEQEFQENWKPSFS